LRTLRPSLPEKTLFPAGRDLIPGFQHGLFINTHDMASGSPGQQNKLAVAAAIIVELLEAKQP
jgi:hypothetical protein